MYERVEYMTRGHNRNHRVIQNRSRYQEYQRPALGESNVAVDEIGKESAMRGRGIRVTRPADADMVQTDQLKPRLTCILQTGQLPTAFPF